MSPLACSRARAHTDHNQYNEKVGHVRRLNERLRREYGLDLASWAEEQQEQEGAV